LSSVKINTVCSQFLIMIVMYVVMLLSPYAVGVFFFIISMLVLSEIFNCLHQYNPTIKFVPLKILSYVMLPFIPILFVYKPVLIFVLVICYWALCAIYWVTRSNVSQSAAEISAVQLALFSILSLGLFPLLKMYPQGSSFCLYIFFLSNCCDLAGLLGGKVLGGRQLTPYLSPKKTIYGSITALIACIILSFLFSAILHLPFTIIQALFLGLVVGIFAQVGDLFASIFKRLMNIKDYGTMIPGHGGILDRMDSSIFSLPIFIVMLIIFNY